MILKPIIFKWVQTNYASQVVPHDVLGDVLFVYSVLHVLCGCSVVHCCLELFQT